MTEELLRSIVRLLQKKTNCIILLLEAVLSQLKCFYMNLGCGSLSFFCSAHFKDLDKCLPNFPLYTIFIRVSFDPQRFRKGDSSEAPPLTLTLTLRPVTISRLFPPLLDSQL